MKLQLKSKDNSKFTKEVVFNSVKNILSTNTAYKWVSTEEPFINNYGKLCFDYSGEVVKMSCDEYHTIINSDSVISDILSDLHVNRWEATYTSNYGKHWVNYLDLTTELIEDYINKNYDCYNEVEDEPTELYYELMDFYYAVVDNTKLKEMI